MTRLNSVIQYLDSLLEIDRYEDASLNGLQVEARPDHNVEKLAFAVDAGESVIDSAVEQGADCLLVHHGLFWGGMPALSGAMGRKVARLIRGNCSLYAAHLPLDGNLEVGNAAEIARLLNFADIEPCFEYRGMPIGVKCVNSEGIQIDDIIEKAQSLPGFTSPLILPSGPKTPQTIGIATGAAASLLSDCPALGIDTLISGEPKQEAYHVAKELKLNGLFLGHYATETTGVKAVARRLEKDLDISTVFIDEPTGI